MWKVARLPWTAFQACAVMGLRMREGVPGLPPHPSPLFYRTRLPVQPFGAKMEFTVRPQEAAALSHPCTRAHPHTPLTHPSAVPLSRGRTCVVSVVVG